MILGTKSLYLRSFISVRAAILFSVNDEIAMIMSEGQNRQMFSKDETADLLCMKMDKNYKSNTFQKRSARCITHWNNDTALIYRINVSASTDSVYTRSKESTWFSINVPVLLGVIKGTDIFFKKSSASVQAFPTSKMSIVEYNQRMFPVNGASSKTLYATTMKLASSETFSLPQPIRIHPDKMYEIRFEITMNKKEYFYVPREESDYKLDQEIWIKIHKNPAENESDQRGFVSEMHFNRI